MTMNHPTRLSRIFLREQNGNILIELAFILPILVTLLIGALDVGVLLNEYLRLVDSARSAAETATIRIYNLNYLNSTNYSLLQVVGTSDANLPNYALQASSYCMCGPNSATFACGTGSTNYAYCGTYGQPNPYVKVVATATLPLIFNLRGLPGSINVQATAIARITWVGTGS